MQAIGSYLRIMIISSKEEEMKRCYQHAVHYLIYNLVKLAKPDKIKNNSSYKHNIKGNIDLKGDMSSEQNH